MPCSRPGSASPRDSRPPLCRPSRPRPSLHRRLRLAAVLLLPLLFLVTGSSFAGEGAGGAVWDLGTLQADRVYPTEITARNVDCAGSHTFIVSVVDAPWLRITGPDRLEDVALGGSRTTPARVDLRGVEPGEHRGEIRFRCVTCPGPPVCELNKTSMEVRLRVEERPHLELIDAPALYFQDQTVDRLLTFRISGPDGMVVTRLTARWEPLPRDSLMRVFGHDQVAYCSSRPYEIERSRPEATPVNTVTWFRVQEDRLDELAVQDCVESAYAGSGVRPSAYPVAKGRWRMRATVALPDGERTLESVDRCTGEEEREAGPGRCPRRMLLVRGDARVLEVGCDRDFDQVWQRRVPFRIDEVPQGSSGARPRGADGLDLAVTVTEHRIPLSGVTLETLAGYGDPLSHDGDNPELQLAFHVAPAVDSSDLPRGDLRLRAEAEWHWSGLAISLDSHHDPHFWENLAIDVAEDLWLTAATAGFAGAPAGVPFLFGSTSGTVLRSARRQAGEELADFALEAGGAALERQAEKLLERAGLPIPLNPPSALQKLGEWAAGPRSFRELSVARAYGGHESPPFLATGDAETRSLGFYLYSVAGSPVQVATYDDRDFREALSGDVEFTAPPPDTPWPQLRFFLGGVAAVGTSNRTSQTRSAEVRLRRLDPDRPAVRFRFRESALHESCPGFDPAPAPGLDPTFLETVGTGPDRPTVATATEARGEEALPPAGGDEDGAPSPAGAEASGDGGAPTSVPGDGEEGAAGTDPGADPDPAAAGKPDDPKPRPSFRFVRESGTVLATAGGAQPVPFHAELASVDGFAGEVRFTIGPLPGPGWGVEVDGHGDLTADQTLRMEGSLLVASHVEPGTHRVVLVAEHGGRSSTYELQVVVH